jgi:conjugal transfer/entry exclusion protein
MKTDNPTDQKSNEVDNIRTILFGEQIRQVTNQFDLVEKSINSLRIENQNLRQALEMEVSQREKETSRIEGLIQELNLAINNQLGALGSLLLKYQQESVKIEKEMVEQLGKAIHEYQEKSSK